MNARVDDQMEEVVEGKKQSKLVSFTHIMVLLWKYHMEIKQVVQSVVTDVTTTVNDKYSISNSKRTKSSLRNN